MNIAEAAFRWKDCFVRADIIEKKGRAEALLRYCELDTMSMVFIWEYFHEMTGM